MEKDQPLTFFDLMVQRNEGFGGSGEMGLGQKCVDGPTDQGKWPKVYKILEGTLPKGEEGSIVGSKWCYGNPKVAHSEHPKSQIFF